MKPVLDEQGLRRYAAMEALSLGHGGVSAMSEISGLARSTIGRGIKDIRSGHCAPDGRVRRAGAGREPKIAQDPTLLKDLKALLAASTRGDPMCPLLWTTRSVRHLVAELARSGHVVSRTLVCELLHDLGYSLQANSKTKEGNQHIDRDAQFRYINEKAMDFLRRRPEIKASNFTFMGAVIASRRRSNPVLSKAPGLLRRFTPRNDALLVDSFILGQTLSSTAS